MDAAQVGANQDPSSGRVPWLVIDSGGGSTQVVLGEDATPKWGTSLPIGAGALSAHALAHDPPKRKELQAMAAQIAAHVDLLPRRLSPQMAILMGGSADHSLKLAAHPRRGLLTPTDLEGAMDLLRQRSANNLARDYNMPAERARLLPAGALILLHILRHYAVDSAHVKPHGIRGGFIVCVARAGAQWLEACPVPAAVGIRAGT